MIESAARTVSEMGSISKDPDLLAAANKHLDEQISADEAGKRMISAMNSKSPLLSEKKVDS